MTEPTMPPLDGGSIAAFEQNWPAMQEVIKAGSSTSAEALAGAAELTAALAVLAKAGISLPAGGFTLGGLSGARVRDDRHRCHRCDNVATAQWQRRATAGEAEAWHAAREQHIRAHNDGRAAAEYVLDRSDVVTMAVHGCDEHVVADAHLTHDADCGGHGACGCGGDDAQAV